MNRIELEHYIMETYSAEPDHPWRAYPDYTVFRHPGSRKWFALFMEVPKKRLGLSGDEPLSILNLKCEPLLIDSLLKEPGFFPAYHMHKGNWISASLDGSIPDEMLKQLLSISYESTLSKPLRKTRPH